MYCLSRFCCLCFCNETKLKLLNQIKCNNTSFTNLANTVIPELEFLDLNQFLLICDDCTRSLMEMYAFRQSCVEKNHLFVEYVRQLRRNGCRIGDVRIEMIDVENRSRNTVVKIETDDMFFECVKVEDNVANESIVVESNETEENLIEAASHSFKPGMNENVRIKLEDNFFVYDRADDERYGKLENIFIDTGTSQELDRNDFPTTDPLDDVKQERAESWRFTTEKKHKCDTCGKAFICLSKLKVHKMIHSGEKPFKCDACEKSFPSLNKLNIHRVVHTGERPYKCDICGKSFTQKNNLYSHGVIHSGERPYKCEICGKTFNRSNWLKTHVFIHTGEKPHKCEICERPFSCLKNLKRHIKTHSVREPYKCHVCEKTYLYFSELQRHVKTHRENATDDEKPFKCEICEKVFSHSCNLKRHYFIHTGEKPHKCDVCGKCFSLVWDLKRHTMTHSRERANKNGKS